MLNVLIACEESQTELTAFLNAGCNAYSCDLQRCSGPFPSRHILGDALKAIIPGSFVMLQDGFPFCTPKWDLIIAHPPCTYLSKEAGNLLFKGHTLNTQRYEKGLEAREFFMQLYNAPARFVAVENPIPFRIFNLPPPSCAVDPYDFGAPWRKKTLFWLRNLPPLMSTIIHPTPRSYVYSTKGSKKRSKSFDVIANAMAAQWVPVVLSFKLI